MQIVCPNCGARYLAPDDQIGPNGRRVRCARCSHVWRSDPPPPPEPGDSAPETPPDVNAPFGDDSPPDSPPAPDGEAVATPDETDPPSHAEGESATDGDGAPERPLRVDPLPRNRLPAPQTAQPQRRGSGGWVLFVVVVLLLAVAFYLGRGPIMQYWPASAVLYRTIGIAPQNGAPAKSELEVGELANSWEETAEGWELVLRGSVINNGERERPAPYLRIRLYDGENRIVRDKRQPLKGGPLRPGENRKFVMRFKDPGEVARFAPVLEEIR